METQQICPGPTDIRQTAIEFQKDPIAYLSMLYREYGDIVHYQLGRTHVYLISSSELLRQVLVEYNDQMERTKLTRDTVGKFFGENLAVSAGEFHRRQRRTIQPVFTPAWINTYSQLMTDCTATATHDWADGEIRDIAQDMMLLTQDIVYQTIFGAKPSVSRQEIRDAITVFQRYSGEMLKRAPTISDSECQQASDLLDKALEDLIDQHRDVREKDLLTLLLETSDPMTGQRMSDKQVRDEALTMFVGGQDTSAIGLTWTLYLLSQYPDVETKLLSELTVLNGHTPSSEDLYSLPYTERVIKESMRLYPPAWLIGRKPIETVTLGGYEISPESSIAICSYVFHRNPIVFPEPETFNPDRFQVEPPKYAYLPFGGGPHVCIGQHFAMLEMALALIILLQRFHFELIEGQVIEPEPLVNLRVKGNLKVKITRR